MTQIVASTSTCQAGVVVEALRQVGVEILASPPGRLLARLGNRLAQWLDSWGNDDPTCGYPSGGKKASDLRQPPSGPAPGSPEGRMNTMSQDPTPAPPSAEPISIPATVVDIEEILMPRFDSPEMIRVRIQATDVRHPADAVFDLDAADAALVAIGAVVTITITPTPE